MKNNNKVINAANEDNKETNSHSKQTKNKKFSHRKLFIRHLNYTNYY